MKIDRYFLKNVDVDSLVLLKRANERYLKWDKLAFWEDNQNLSPDMPSRIIISIALVVFLLLTGFNFFIQWTQYKIVQTEAVIAEIEIVNKDSSTVRATGSEFTNYYLTYRIEYENESYTTNVKVDGASYEATIIGTEFQSLFLPSSRHIVEWSMQTLQLISFASFLLLCVTIGTSLYFYRVWYRKGVLVAAEIISLERTEKHSDKGVHEIYQITYQVQSPKSKKLLKGQSNAPVSANFLLEEGQSLVVLYEDEKTLTAL